jgi:hypothetical protein
MTLRARYPGEHYDDVAGDIDGAMLGWTSSVRRRFSDRCYTHTTPQWAMAELIASSYVEADAREC